MWQRHLPGFLSPRERVVLLTVARSEGFRAPVAGASDERKHVLEHLGCARLIKRAAAALGGAIVVDAWLSRLPVGAEQPARIEGPTKDGCRVRLCALVLAPLQGDLYLDGAEQVLDEGDAWLSRPDLVREQVTRVERNPRIVFCVEAQLAEAEARALFAH